jgi:hypothetical protein
MDLVAEAASFSAREAVKARQLARSIEDQEQCGARSRMPLQQAPQQHRDAVHFA